MKARSVEFSEDSLNDSLTIRKDMSLLTDKAFYNALVADESIVQVTENRIYSTSVPVPDEELDNTPLPYIIITYDGMHNGGYTKDDSFEGSEDTVQVGIMAVAASRHELGVLMTAIRTQVDTFFVNADDQTEDFDLIPDSYDITATDVAYDSLQPCYYQTLKYQCETKP